MAHPASKSYSGFSEQQGVAQSDFAKRCTLWSAMTDEQIQFEKRKVACELADMQHMLSAVADEYEVELDLADFAAETAQEGDIYEAVTASEEREEIALQARKRQQMLDELAQPSSPSEIQPFHARRLKKWKDVFGVGEGDPMTPAEHEALAISQSLWSEREVKSGTAAWHAAVANKMDFKSTLDMQARPLLSARLHEPRTAVEAHKEPRRGQCNPYLHSGHYSRTDSVWKARVDDWCRHGGNKIRAGHPDAMALTTKDPFPLGARCRGVLTWSAGRAVEHSQRHSDSYNKGLYAQTKAVQSARAAMAK